MTYEYIYKTVLKAAQDAGIDLRQLSWFGQWKNTKIKSERK